MTKHVARQAAVALFAAALLSACSDEASRTALVGPEPRFDDLPSVLPLLCPVDVASSAIATVGPDGGEIAVAGHKLTVPAGVLEEPVEFTLTEPVSQHLEIDLRADGEPHYSFAAPVEVSISYSRCSSALDTDALTAWYWDPLTGELLEKMGATHDSSALAVTFSTDHFSGYVVAN